MPIQFSNMLLASFCQISINSKSLCMSPNLATWTLFFRYQYLGKFTKSAKDNLPTISYGCTGRRDLPPEMWFVMREEVPEARAMLPVTIPWVLLQGIALIQLYVQE